MVFFTCDKCGEALKKNQVEKHTYKCRYASYSCIDCNAVFTANSYKDHIKCITEDQKYGGKNYVPKENKGEVKQNQWVEQVERAIANVCDKRVKNLLEQIRGFGNIPRKEAKFINFLQNSIRIRDRSLCVQAWNCISAEAKKMSAEANTAKAEASAKQNGTESTGKSNDIASSATEGSSNVNSNFVEHGNSVINGRDTGSSGKVFKWKKAIKRALKGTDDGSMKVKRLRKTVVEMFRADGFEMDDSEMKETFNHKLESSGIVVDGKIARLS